MCEGATRIPVFFFIACDVLGWDFVDMWMSSFANFSFFLTQHLIILFIYIFFCVRVKRQPGPPFLYRLWCFRLRHFADMWISLFFVHFSYFYSTFNYFLIHLHICSVYVWMGNKYSVFCIVCEVLGSEILLIWHSFAHSYYFSQHLTLFFLLTFFFLCMCKQTTNIPFSLSPVMF